MKSLRIVLSSAAAVAAAACLFATPFTGRTADASERYLFPVEGCSLGSVVSSYGSRWGTFHHGIDIAASGNRVLATKSGRIVRVFTGCTNYAGLNGTKCSSRSSCHPTEPYSTVGHSAGYCNWGYGNGCILEYEEGGQYYYALYAHMGTVTAKLGPVSQGAVLGTVGASGSADGPHLHFQLTRGMTNASARGYFPSPVHEINPQKVSYTSVASPQTATVNPSLTFVDFPAHEQLLDTSATLSQRVLVSGISTNSISEIGVNVYDSAGNLLGQGKDTSDLVRYSTYMNMWYNTASDIGITLTPGTTYTDQFYCVANGKTYLSDKETFTTQAADETDLETGLYYVSYTVSDTDFRTGTGEDASLDRAVVHDPVTDTIAMTNEDGTVSLYTKSMEGMYASNENGVCRVILISGPESFTLSQSGTGVETISQTFVMRTAEETAESTADAAEEALEEMND